MRLSLRKTESFSQGKKCRKELRRKTSSTISSFILLHLKRRNMSFRSRQRSSIQEHFLNLRISGPSHFRRESRSFRRKRSYPRPTRLRSHLIWRRSLQSLQSRYFISIKQTGTKYTLRVRRSLMPSRRLNCFLQTARSCMMRTE